VIKLTAIRNFIIIIWLCLLKQSLPYYDSQQID
jgi:hypothetical protein